MSSYLIPVNQGFVNRMKKFTLIVAIVLLPLFLFLFSGQSIYASMNSPTIFHKEGIVNAVKPLVVAGAPTIDVWYGDEQQFGQIGNPQQWINILGNVSDTDGIDTLTYTLNGGSVITLSVGPDLRRLGNAGDFNADIDKSDLISGVNEVVITAVDDLGNSASKTVSVTYQTGNTWPSSYSIDWSTVSDIQSVAQVVDGEWQLPGNGVRSYVPQYDRLIGIGDMAWTDYEVVVPITVHSVDSAGFTGNSYKPNVGVVMRWTGHTDTPVGGWQPKSGYYPAGAIAWWEWDTLDSARLAFFDTGTTPEETDFTPQLNTQYIMKVRVESASPLGGNYKIKVWQNGEAEPTSWNLTHQADASNLANGSILLIAHHVDATFGDISIYPIGSPITYDLTTAVSGNGSVVADPNQVTFNAGEVVTLTATPVLGNIFTNWSGDVTGNTNPILVPMTNDITATANFVADSNKVLIVGTIGSGSVAKNPDKVDYLSGEVVTVTATPIAGWLFNGWSGDVASLTNPLALTMNANKNITATFVDAAATAYTLTVNTVGNGTVTSDPLQVTYGAGAAVTLTAIADSGWLFDSWDGALSGTTNPQSLIMDSDKEVTGTFVIDVGAPIISNVITYTFPTKAIIQWQTNELATSRVDYGTTASYTENVNDSEQVITHTLVLPSLNPSTLYHYKITSVDDESNSTSTVDATFTTPAVATDNSGIVSDDFNAGTLNTSLWTFVNPVGDGTESLNGTELLLNVPADVDHDIWDNGNRSVRVMQPANNTDFEIEAKFESTLTSRFQMQGMLVEQDSNNFLRFDFYSDGYSNYILAVSFTGGIPTIVFVQELPESWGPPMFMRVTRMGDDWFLWSSQNGTDWEIRTVISFAMTVSQVGVFGANAENLPAHTAVVDYFFNTASPIDPEDSNPTPLVLTTNPVGVGTIAKDPNNANFAFGDVVTLTANANAGSTFTHWSGDAIGSSNPITITMDTDKTVTSTFLSDAVTSYAITPSIVGNGSVTVIPDKVRYLPGEVVTVTAVADAGWVFSAWSGAISSTAVSTTITMNSNKAITATFVPNSLTVNKVGNGNVTVSPVKANYNAGEVVTLTAVADAGWTFNSWSGDITGSTSPKTITMNGSKVVTATFIENSVETFNLNISKVGNGNVTVTPDKASYLSGEQVTVTAVPDAGWQFANWSGASSSTSNPVVITMNANKSLTANFTAQSFSITRNIDGDGSITIQPNLSSYTYGQIVTITANAAVGSEFDYWSGGLSGSTNPQQITITGNVAVTAHFKDVKHYVFLPMIVK